MDISLITATQLRARRHSAAVTAVYGGGGFMGSDGLTAAFGGGCVFRKDDAGHLFRGLGSSKRRAVSQRPSPKRSHLGNCARASDGTPDRISRLELFRSDRTASLRSAIAIPRVRAVRGPRTNSAKQ